MAKTRRFQNNFTTGELAPSAYELYNLAKHSNALRTLKNCTIKPAGGLKRRDGTRFVSLAKRSGEDVRLIPFVFSRSQSYILELGPLYIRFYRDEGQLISGGLPVEVPTPYFAADIPDIDFAQDSDTMVFTHPDFPPQVLKRFSDTNWSFKELLFSPPPTSPKSHSPGITVTLALLSGNTFSLTAAATAFHETDVGRTFRDLTEDGTGEAIVTGYTSATVLTVEVTKSFTQLILTSGQWELGASPLGALSFTRDEDGLTVNGNPGDLASVYHHKFPSDATNLLTNSDFATGDFTGWTTQLGQTVASGTLTTSAIGRATITGNARELGVQPNHTIVLDTLSGTGTPETSLVASLNSTPGGGLYDIINLQDTLLTPVSGEGWRVEQTSFGVFPGGGVGVELHTGPNGVAQVRQSITVDQQAVYEYRFTIEHDAATFRIGSAVGLADIFESTLLSPGESSGTFVVPNFDATATMTIFLVIENNQFNTFSTVLSASIIPTGIDALGLESDVGDFIRANGGYLQILSQPSDARSVVVVLRGMNDTLDALGGAWTIERSQWFAGAYPAHVAFYQGRLVFTGGLKVWGSDLLDNSSFAFGTGATDAYEFVPAATQVNPPHWIVGESVMLIGTRSEEYIVSGTQTALISPSDIDVSSPTAIGSEPIKPVRINQAVLMVKGGGKRVIEFTLDGTDERRSRDLSVLASHLVARGDKISAIAWQEEPHQQLWCVTTLGRLYSLTYVREQDVWAWCQHDAEDGALFKSVAVIPHPDSDRDEVWFAIRRTSNTFDVVEHMDDAGGTYTNDPALTVDGGIRYSGVSTTTISGLSHLINLSDVWVIDAQGAQGPHTVSAGGQVTVARAVTEADIGVNFIPSLTTLRPSLEGNGPTGLIIGNTNLFGSFIDTGEGVFANNKLLKMRRPTDLMDSRIVPFEGELPLPQLGQDRTATVTISQIVPETFNLLSIAGTITVEDF